MGDWAREVTGSVCPWESGGGMGKGICGTAKDKSLGPRGDWFCVSLGVWWLGGELGP